MNLKNKTLFISGGSRGIGLAIAKRAAADGANIAIAAKTTEPDSRLPGTIYSAAEEIESEGGSALPIVCDIRDEAQVNAAIQATGDRFGGIDICVNNASAISLTDTKSTSMKRYDLMHQVNARGTYLVSQSALPWLELSSHAHILNLSPPLDMRPQWFGQHVAYTMAKYGMSMCVLGMAEEFRSRNIGVNALWPLTAIDTAAVRNVIGVDSTAHMCRRPEIMGDAAHSILCRDPATTTGNFFIDEEVLLESGVEDLSRYQHVATKALLADGFIPDDVFARSHTRVVHQWE